MGGTAGTKTREAMLREEIAGLRKLVVDIKASSCALTQVPALAAEKRPEDEPLQALPSPAQENRKKAKAQTISAMAQRFVLNDASKSADTSKAQKQPSTCSSKRSETCLSAT